MLKIKSDVLYVRNPDTKEFEPVAAIRGADGIVENLSAFSTSEIGNSTYLLMTQKGASDILSGLMNGDYVVAHAGGADIADYATNAGHAETANHAETATEAATANEALHALRTDHVDKADEADSVSVMWSYMDETQFIAFTDDNGEISINENLTYNPKTKTLTVAKIAGKATEADTADKVTITTDNSSKYARSIPFVGVGGELYNHAAGFTYTPSSKTLKVGTVKGNVEGNVTGNVTGTATNATSADSLNLKAGTLKATITDGAGSISGLGTNTVYMLYDGHNVGLFYPNTGAAMMGVNKLEFVNSGSGISFYYTDESEDVVEEGYLYFIPIGAITVS